MVAVNCSEPGETCFCVSTGSGPDTGPGYDVALTEMPEGYVADAGTDAGWDLLARVPSEAAGPALAGRASAAVAGAGERMRRRLPAGDLRALLGGRLGAARGGGVAALGPLWR